MLISKLYLVFVFPICGSAFIGSTFISEKPLPDLKRVVEAQHQKRLSFGLDIGTPGDVSRLAIDRIVFDLTKHTPKSTDDFVKMPGAHGPPQMKSLSGGVHTLNVVNNGSFISMAGSEIVETLKGCWEIIWRDGDPGGSLTCGFEVDQDYKRNEATLPKGNVYVSFSAWTSKGLKQAQDRENHITELASTALKKKREELDKMADTTNLMRKALHYYNAVHAAEEYSMLPIAGIKNVPGPEDVVHLEGDLYVSTKGMVWARNKPQGKQIIIGNALIKSDSKKREEVSS